MLEEEKVVVENEEQKPAEEVEAAEPAVAAEPAEQAEVAAPSEPAQEEEPAAPAKPHKLSDNACRWIYFGLTGLLLVVMVILQWSHTIITVFDWTFDVEGTTDFIKNLNTWFNSGAVMAVHAAAAMVMMIFLVAGTIIFTVRFILLLIGFFGFLKSGQERNLLQFKFRRALRQVAKVAGFYLLVDFYYAIIGAGLPKPFVFDLLILILMFAGSGLNYTLYETFNRDGKFNWKILVPELCYIALYTFIGVFACIYLSHLELLNAFIAAAGNMSGENPDLRPVIYTGVSLIFGLVAAIFGTNLITKTAYYYPHNDSSKKEEKPALLQVKNIVNSVLFLVFMTICGGSQLLNGQFTEIKDFAIQVVLVPAVLLAMAICLRVAYGLDRSAQQKQ